MAKSVLDYINDASKGFRAVVMSDQQNASIEESARDGLQLNAAIWRVPTTQASPAAGAMPAAYFRFDELGKQQFCIRFSNGVVQVIATEPD